MLCYYIYMQTTIYIRKENEDKWNEIKDKSLFVNIALSQMDEPGVGTVYALPKDTISQTRTGLAKIPGVSVGTANIKPQPMCKHGQRGGCPVKRCV